MMPHWQCGAPGRRPPALRLAAALEVADCSLGRHWHFKNFSVRGWRRRRSTILLVDFSAWGEVAGHTFEFNRGGRLAAEVKAVDLGALEALKTLPGPSKGLGVS